MGNQPGKLQNQNQSGRPKKNVHWKSAERPSPPGRPILIPLSDQQPDVVSLRWERPKLDGGSPITGYIVEHRRMGSPHWVRATPTPVIRCEVSISGLEPGWRYQFRTFAENIVGRSDPSELSDALTVTLQRNAISVPRFIDELQDMHAVEDERIEFRVRVLGQPPPEINWFKDGYEIFSSRRTKIVNDNDVSALIIHQVALTDEGEIKCTATNRAGHVVTKARLLVQAPPKIRLPRTYEDGLIVEADEVLRLKVGIAGQPPPNVLWLHEGELVTHGGRFEIVNTERNSLLKIDNVQRYDRGEYSIRASNKLGEDVTSFLVTVTARPNPPGKVRLNMSFGKSATLSWTSPIDDGGCKIGNYIVEYFRIGWNVWLKAATTRSLSTTLNDLIEGSEYKFRVKAENPYGLSDPSEESDVLFIPDPKRGITKPKSATKLDDNGRPTPPRRKTLSPQRPQQDASTETAIHISPMAPRKQKPQLLDNEDLHREMSYGTPDQVLKMDVRKSPSLSNADAKAQESKPKLSLKIEKSPKPVKKSPQRSPTLEVSNQPQFLQQIVPANDKPRSPLLQRPPPLATPERSATPETIPGTDKNKTNLNAPRKAPLERKSSPQHKNISPVEPMKSTPALQRSAEPAKLDVNQHVRRYSGHSLSPAKNAPALAIAIATGTLGAKAPNGNVTNNSKTILNGSDKQNASTLTNPTIQISAPAPTLLTPRKAASSPTPVTVCTTTTATTPISSPPVTSSITTTTATTDIISPTISPPSPPKVPLITADRHDDVHTSNEFMLVVFDKNSKVKEKDKQDSFELDLEDAIQPPPISISSPDLASLEFTNLHTFPLRRSVSSTELLYERAMARFYEAVELEEAEKARKLKLAQDKLAPPSNVQPTTVRKRLGSMTETERLSFERRSELRRQSADIVQDLKVTLKWSSRENLSSMTPLTRSPGMLISKQDDTPESEEELSDYESHPTNKNDSFELGSDYTESTAPSEDDSIEKFKIEMMARTRSPSPRELETYHPRSMATGVFTPYRAPTPEQAVVVLNRPMPLPSPDFVPKPILKRTTTESIHQNDESPINGSSNFNNSPKPSSNGKTSTLNSPSPDPLSNNLSIPTPLSNTGIPTNPDKSDNELFADNSANPAGTSTSSSNPHSPTNVKSPVSEKLDIAKGIKSFFKRDKRDKNADAKEKAAALADAEAEAKRTAKEEEEEVKRREAERIMREEAHAAVDHYSDLVQQVSSTHKYHTPLYLDRDELKKAAEKAALEEDTNLDISVTEQMKLQKTYSPVIGLLPPTLHKPRLSISERGQLKHVRETASDLAVVGAIKAMASDTPSEDSTQQMSELSADLVTSEVVSESTVERPDSRGRTRIVKVKRIVKKRVSSSTRSRDASANRPPSNIPSVQDIRESTAVGLRRTPLRMPTESRSPGAMGRKALISVSNQKKLSKEHIEQVDEDTIEQQQQFSENTHEKVRSALSYSTDLVLFMVACYVYLFKDARLVLPILALMIYRQLGEAISEHIPSWFLRKKP